MQDALGKQQCLCTTITDLKQEHKNVWLGYNILPGTLNLQEELCYVYLIKLVKMMFLAGTSTI